MALIFHLRRYPIAPARRKFSPVRWHRECYGEQDFASRLVSIFDLIDEHTVSFRVEAACSSIDALQIASMHFLLGTLPEAQPNYVFNDGRPW